MKALTVRHPWAQCIASGRKTIENRTRQVSYRGPLAIHTSARGFDEMALLNPIVLEALMDVRGASWHHGRIIAVATLADCHRCDGACSPWAEAGAWHLELADIRALSHGVTAKGQLGLWTPDEATTRRIAAQLEADR
jgi:hypothetical protein